MVGHDDNDYDEFFSQLAPAAQLKYLLSRISSLGRVDDSIKRRIDHVWSSLSEEHNQTLSDLEATWDEKLTSLSDRLKIIEDERAISKAKMAVIATIASGVFYILPFIPQGFGWLYDWIKRT